MGTEELTAIRLRPLAELYHCKGPDGRVLKATILQMQVMRESDLSRIYGFIYMLCLLTAD
jgi:hypothetical protein